MTASPDMVLTRAYELIEANQIDEAREMLQPLLNEHPNDPDLWWVYAHAVTSPDDAYNALQKVKALDPEHPDVDQLLNEVGPRTTAPESSPAPKIRKLQPKPPTLPVDNDDDDLDLGDDFDDDLEFEPSSSDNSGRQFPLIPMIILALVVLGVILAVLFAGGFFSSTPPPTTTSIAEEPTSASTDVPIALGVPSVTAIPATAVAQVAITEEGLATTEETVLAETEEATAAENETEESIAVVETEEPVAATEEMTAEPVETEEMASAMVTEEAMAATEDTTNEPIETEEMAAAVATDEPVAAETEEPVPTETSTPVPSDTPTDEPTETPTDEPTSTPERTETPEPSPTSDPIEELGATFEDFDLYEVSPFIEAETDSGEALLAAVCVTNETDRGALLTDGMATFASTVDTVPQSVEAVGIALQDCERERTQRAIVVSRETAEAFASNEIDATEFQLEWQVTGIAN